ncbi:phosphate-starvation-inducible PsiE family protein [Synechococcus sp. RSCCF101]|uniref:phosphate-starvation-inducible PsiE family protein n=1 Tax=Synechococcus sp. RSCCF101 TaxID=2511069 RepID=UPI00351A1584
MAKILTVVMGVVIVASIVQLIVGVSTKLAQPDSATWLGDSLIKVLGDTLTILIALEVLQNITSYLRRHVVQVELVLVTALTAVARKVIVLPAGAEDKPALLGGLALATLALAAAYWLVRQPVLNPEATRPSRAASARSSLDRDPSAAHGGDDRH